MMKLEEQALRNVLRRAAVKEPSPDLTEHIFEQLLQEEAKTSVSETLFKATLKEIKTSPTPTALSHSIMSQLESKKSRAFSYRPLIGKGVKYVYAFLMVIGLSYLLINNTFSFKTVLALFNEYSANFTLLITCCFCLIGFAFLDVFLKKRYPLNRVI